MRKIIFLMSCFLVCIALSSCDSTLSDESISPSPTENAVSEIIETVIYDSEGIKISFLGFEQPPAPLLGYYINLRIENTSEIDYMLQVEDVSSGDIVIPFGSYIFSPEVPAGKTLNDHIWVINLEDLGVVTPLTSAEFRFVLFPNKNLEDKNVSDIISIGS